MMSCNSNQNNPESLLNMTINIQIIILKNANLEVDMK